MLVIFIIVLVLGFGVTRYALSRYEQHMALGRRAHAPEKKTGADIAAEFLAAHEVHDVVIVKHNAVVSDYFDPKRRRLFLRSETHDGYDLAAWGVALHEAAHALQLGDDKSALQWRQTCISLSRYLPVAAAAAALSIVVFLKRPARFGLIIFAAACVVALLLNIGTLAIEFNANKRVLRWLEDRLDHAPGAQDKLQQILSSVATREVGDLLKSPRYFFLSALPGTSRSRPLKSEDTNGKTDA